MYACRTIEVHFYRSMAHLYIFSMSISTFSIWNINIYIYIDSTFGVASLPLSLCQSHSVQILAPSTVGRLRQAGRCSDKKGQFQVTLCQDVWIKYLKGKRHWLILHWWKSIAIRTMLQDIHFDYYSISIFVCKSVQRHIYTHTCARPPLCLSLSLSTRYMYIVIWYFCNFCFCQMCVSLILNITHVTLSRSLR